MGTPAGWYDGGSGRQRWWDGAQWTENYAPESAGAPAADSDGPVANPIAVPAAPAHSAPASATAPLTAPKQASTLGFIGLGLAVLGTVLACIPSFVTFGIACFVLLAAFVVSLIAVFKRGTTKWPSIVGIALSIIGGVIGVIVLIVTIATAVSSLPGPDMPPPTSSTSEQPSDPSTGDSEGRPSPEEIAAGYLLSLKDEQGIDEFKTPEVMGCMGQELYDSDLSDELLRKVAAGTIINYDTVGKADGDAFLEVGNAAIDVCSPYDAG